MVIMIPGKSSTPCGSRGGREWKEKMYSYEISNLDESAVIRLTVPLAAAASFNGLTIHGSLREPLPRPPRKAWAVHYVREGTWVTRCDVQETMPVTI